MLSPFSAMSLLLFYWFFDAKHILEYISFLSIENIIIIFVICLLKLTLRSLINNNLFIPKHKSNAYDAGNAGEDQG